MYDEDFPLLINGKCDEIIIIIRSNRTVVGHNKYIYYTHVRRTQYIYVPNNNNNVKANDTQIVYILYSATVECAEHNINV